MSSDSYYLNAFGDEFDPELFSIDGQVDSGNQQTDQPSSHQRCGAVLISTPWNAQPLRHTQTASPLAGPSSFDLSTSGPPSSARSLTSVQTTSHYLIPRSFQLPMLLVSRRIIDSKKETYALHKVSSIILRPTNYRLTPLRLQLNQQSIHLHLIIRQSKR